MATILVVDQLGAVRAMLEFFLGERQHTVVTAVDGEAAVRQAISGRFDLVFLGIGLPVPDAVAVCQAVRRLPALRELPVIMLATDFTNDVAREATAAGATELIAKPFDWKELGALLRRYLG